MNLAQLKALKPQRAAKTILSDAVRQGLHRYGYTDVHQSGLSTYRECPAKLGFQVQKKQTSYSINMLLGSVLHRAFSYWQDCRDHGHDAEWWQSLFKLVRAEEGERKPIYTFKGEPVKWPFLNNLCFQFTNQDALGLITLGEMVVRTVERLDQMGYTIVANELVLTHRDGERHPIDFTGTLDMKVVNRGNLGILDTKSYGLWAAFLHGKSASKEEMSENEITYNNQLRHYHWLHWLRYPNERIEYYGMVLPTNLVPYKKSGAWGVAGTPKGQCAFVAPAIDFSFVKDYEHQVVQWLTQISKGVFFKGMPTNFGKTVCPDCPYFDHCLKDSSASRVAALADADAYAYLHE